jgi:hypothetical protein
VQTRFAVAPAAVHPVPEEEPAAQLEQVTQAVAPVLPTYVPTAQSVHAAELTTLLYLPATQVVHTRLVVEPSAAQPAADVPAAQVEQAGQAVDPVALA